MKHLIAIFLFFILLAPINKVEAKKIEPLKVVIFGDSLVSGYSVKKEFSFKNALENKLKSLEYRHVRILDGTLTGQTTALALERTPIVIEYKPEIVILALGSNDALASVKISTIYQNLIKIIESLKEHNIKILLAGVKLPKGSKPDYQDKLQGMYEYLADKYRLELYPNLIKDIAGNPELTIPDRFHPNKSGIETMVNNIYPHLEIIFYRQFKDTVLRKRLENEKLRQ